MLIRKRRGRPFQRDRVDDANNGGCHDYTNDNCCHHDNTVRAQAEAEVEELVTEFWLSPFDTSTGELRLKYLTGLPARRLEEGVQQLEEQGQLIRNQGQESIQVTSVEVDLETGEGEITACTGESGERLDAETMERIVEAADPEYLTTTVFYFQLTPDGWKISEFVGSAESESPELCEITSQ